MKIKYKIHAVQREMRQMKNQYLKEKRDEVKGSISGKVLRATQKGASSWLTVLPIIEMNFDLNKNEFRDAVKFRYHWVVPDTRSVCVCGDIFGVDYAMMCKRNRFVIQRHNEQRGLELEGVQKAIYFLLF